MIKGLLQSMKEAVEYAKGDHTKDRETRVRVYPHLRKRSTCRRKKVSRVYNRISM